MQKTYVIGDIHGDLASLEKLLAVLQPAADDTLIFLGDYIDRGDQSKQVVDRLIELSNQHTCVFIRGNHEEFLLEALKGSELFSKIWLKHGGRETLASYGVETIEELSEIMPPEHLAFYKSTKHYYETDTHIFTHANWQAGVPAQDQSDSYLRYHFMNHAKPDKSLKKEVVVGHSALMSGKPARRGNLLCIDTIEYDWLTGYDPAAKRFYQVNVNDERSRTFKKAETFSERKHVPAQFRRKPKRFNWRFK